MRIVEAAMRALALVGGLGVLLLMAHVCLDVVLRALGWSPIPATVEIASRYYMVLIAFLPLAWVEHKNGMVSLTLFDEILPRPVLRLSEIAVAILVAATYAILAWIGFRTALQNFQSGAFVVVLNSRLAIWPGYFLPPLAFGLAAIMCLIRVPGLINQGPHRDKAADLF